MVPIHPSQEKFMGQTPAKSCTCFMIRQGVARISVFTFYRINLVLVFMHLHFGK